MYRDCSLVTLSQTIEYIANCVKQNFALAEMKNHLEHPTSTLQFWTLHQNSHLDFVLLWQPVYLGRKVHTPKLMYGLSTQSVMDASSNEGRHSLESNYPCFLSTRRQMGEVRCGRRGLRLFGKRSINCCRERQREDGGGERMSDFTEQPSTEAILGEGNLFTEKKRSQLVLEN
ncbi:hypothetical protein C0J52_11054 [Blattella germanica]|nr:hypothetical protein C0J52_11054 [Blattella germanica]